MSTIIHPNIRRVLLVVVLLAAVAFAVKSAMARHEALAAQEAAPVQPPRVEALPGGGVVVKLTAAEIHSVDLKVEVVSSKSVKDRLLLHGIVMDPLPWLDLQGKLKAAMAQAKAAKASVEASQAELVRIQSLHDADRGASEKALQEIQAKVSSDESAFQVASLESQRLRASWAQQGPIGALEPLIIFHEVIVRIDLPFGSIIPIAKSLSVTESNGAVLKGQILGTAPAASPLTGGVALLARLSGSGLRPGMPVDAFMDSPETSGKTDRMVVPESAVLHQDGLLWVYVAREDGRFERRPIRVAFPVEGGLALEGGIERGEKVVTRGAQTLLGEELRTAASHGDD